jgi:N-acetylmuramic acid 6-phosphate etherase
MLRLGLVHGNLMVAMRSSNKKLVQRAMEIVRSIAGGSSEAASAALTQTAGDIRTAVLVARGMSVDDARTALAAAGGVLRQAMTHRK